MTDFSIQNSNNARIKYLKGLFGGRPYIEGIDYVTIVHEIEGKRRNPDGLQLLKRTMLMVW